MVTTRLASLIKKETKISREDGVEADGIEDKLVVNKESKKVTFSPENEVFEFTRSVKKCKRKNVRLRSKVSAQELQQSGIELRRSKRNVGKGKTEAGSIGNESSARRGIPEAEKECSLPDVKFPRRSKRIGSSGNTQADCIVTELIDLEQFKDIPKGELQMEIHNEDGFKFENLRRQSTRLTANLVVADDKGLAEAENKGDELAKNNMKEVAMKFQVQDTGKYHRKDVQDDHKVENVPRRSRRLVNDIDVYTNSQDLRRSPRSKATAANPSMGTGTSNGRPLCSSKLSKEKRKTKQSKRSVAVNSQEDELVKYNQMKPMKDCEVQKTETYCKMEVQGVSKAETVPRRSKRIGNNVNVLMDKRPLVGENVDDLELEKAPTRSMQLERNASELQLDDQEQKSDKQLKRTYGNDRENTKLLRRSERIAVNNKLDQAVSNSVKRCSVKKLKMDDEMQVYVQLRESKAKTSFEFAGSV